MIKASPVLFVSTLLVALSFLALNNVLVAANLSFASIGDWGCVPIGGWHEEDQLIVAKQFAQAASEIDAQFVLNTGDNFYYCGIESKYDQWWNTTFENVYSEPSMMVPWFNCLGNHDYGYPTSVQSQIDYKSPNKNRWIMPDRYYYRRIEFPGKVNISLVVLDASPCQSPYRSSDASGWDPCGSVIPGCPGCTFHQNVINQSCQAQRAWLQSIIPTIPEGDWKIAMNHAPAMDIDVDDLISDLQGAKFDYYINGHVHLMAHYQIDGKGSYLTTGGGCMVRVPDAEDKVPELERQAKLKKEGKAVDAEGEGDKKKILLKELQQGDEMVKLRKNKKASQLGSTSCTTYSKDHSCSIVFQEKVAGYSTHTFSDDFKSLTTYIYNWEGQLLHQFNTEKSTGGEPGSDSSSTSSSSSGNPSPPNPTAGPSSNSPPVGGCCEMNEKQYCPPGQPCCSEAGNPYDKYNCEKYGWIRGCIWDTSSNLCHVKN